MFTLYCSLGFPGGSEGKESTCNVGDLSLIPELGRSSGEGKGYPLQYSGLENSIDCIVHGVTNSQTGLTDFHFHFGLPWWLRGYSVCLECRRPGFNPWVGKIPQRKEGLPTPVFWPGEFHGLYSPRGCKELDTAEQLSLS